jgi:SlyX protein
MRRYAADLSSNTGMDDSHNIDQRLTDLEIKASFSEDLLDQLNQVIVSQQRQIDLLMREVARLGQGNASADGVQPRNLRDELPPHY